MKLSEKIVSALKGEMVPKAEHDAALSKVAELTAKITELESTVAKLSADTETSFSVQVSEATEAIAAQCEQLQGTVTLLQTENADLKEQLKNPSRQAASILSRASVQVAPDLNVNAGDKKDFPSLVAGLVAQGKTKAQAVVAAIKQFPAAYTEWRQGGNTSTL